MVGGARASRGTWWAHSLEASYLSAFLGAVYAPRTPERLNHGKRQVTCFGASMDRAQATLDSRRPQILFDALGLLRVQQGTNMTVTDTWGRPSVGPEICDSYLELMSWWGVRLGFWIWGFRRRWALERRRPQNGKGAGFWGCGSESIAWRLCSTADGRRSLSMPFLAGCRRTHRPSDVWLAQRALDVRPKLVDPGVYGTTWPPGPPNAWALGYRRLKS